MDFLFQGIPLGRFFGTRITLAFSHIIMLLYLASEVREAGPMAMIITGFVFFISILLHELGHVVACRLVGGTAEQVILGPMGGLAQVQAPDRPLPQFITTAGGPVVNGLLLAAGWALLHHRDILRSLPEGAFIAILMFCAQLFFINQMLLVFNLLPIFPMDGGRLMQHLLWPVTGYRKSLEITGMVGTVGGIGLIVLGTGLWSVKIPYVDMTFGMDNDYFLLFIGITCALASWGLYQRAREVQGWRKN